MFGAKMKSLTNLIALCFLVVLPAISGHVLVHEGEGLPNSEELPITLTEAELDPPLFNEEETMSAVAAILSGAPVGGYDNKNDEGSDVNDKVVDSGVNENGNTADADINSFDTGYIGEGPSQSNGTDIDSTAEQVFDVIDFNSEEPSQNKSEDDVESTDETDSESIQEMLKKLNALMEKYKHCNQNTDPDIEQSFHIMKQSDIQADFDTEEEENETKRTIKDTIMKLNGLMFNGNRCNKDEEEEEAGQKGGTEEKTLIEDKANGIPHLLKDQNVVPESGGGVNLQAVDADDNGEDRSDDFDWTVFEYYPREPRPSVVSILCSYSSELGDGQDEHNTSTRNHDYQHESSHHHHDDHDEAFHNRPADGASSTQNQKIDGDQSCQRQGAGGTTSCIDFFSHESVPAQLCRRLTSLEVELDDVTSQLHSLRQQTTNDSSNDASLVRSEMATLRQEIKTLERKSAFYATASLASGDIANFDTVHFDRVNDFDWATGVFTAPSTGVYRILVNTNQNQVTDERFSIHVKRNQFSDIAIFSGTGSSTQSFNTLAQLETGQTVSLAVVLDDFHEIVDFTKSTISFGVVSVL